MRRPSTRARSAAPTMAKFGEAVPPHGALKRKFNGGEKFVRRQRCFERTAEEIIGHHSARAARAFDDHAGIERQAAGRHFCRRIGRCKAATNRAAIADRGVGDEGQSLCNHSEVLPNHG